MFNLAIDPCHDSDGLFSVTSGHPGYLFHAAMAIEQQLVKLSADVKELGQEASSIASATEQTLDDLLRHFEELQKVSQVPKTSPRRMRHSRYEADLRQRLNSRLFETGDTPWKSRFENFILKQREQSEKLASASSDETMMRLEQALADATFAIEDADCTPSMRRFLMTTLQMLNALAAAESRRRGLLN